MRANAFGASLAALALTASITSCGTIGEADQGSVKIGFVVPYSGVVAKYGKDADHAWKLATEKYGDTVNGRKLEVAKFDEKCQPAAAVSSVRQALGSGVVALIGPTCSGDVTATMQLAQAQKVPLITQAYAPEITGSGNEFVWRQPASDAVLNANLARYLKDKGHQRVAVAHDTTGFGQAEGQTIVDGLTKAGIPPVVTLTYTVGATDFSGEVQRIKAAEVDAVCVMGYDPDPARLAFQMRQLGVDAQLCSNQSVSYTSSLTTAPDAVEGAVFYAPFLAGVDRFAPFVDRWRTAFNEEPDTEGYMYYLSAVTVINALKNVSGEVTGAALNDAIGDLEFDVDGMVTLRFTDTGDPQCPTVMVGTVRDGKPTMLEDDSESC